MADLAFDFCWLWLTNFADVVFNWCSFWLGLAINNAAMHCQWLVTWVASLTALWCGLCCWQCQNLCCIDIAWSQWSWWCLTAIHKPKLQGALGWTYSILTAFSAENLWCLTTILKYRQIWSKRNPSSCRYPWTLSLQIETLPKSIPRFVSL